MKKWLLFVMVLSSLSVWAQEKASFGEIRHLLSRTGFGGTPTEIESLMQMSYEDAVRTLLSDMRTTHVSGPPNLEAETPLYLRKFLTREERQMARKDDRQVGRQLKVWWLKEMITTDSPLTEKMVLFWHNHFTSSLQKVKHPKLLYQQNKLFRKHAKANFAKLVHLVAKDSAMILYLDTQNNRQKKPNENFARELLELFTLGEGNYTEQDIKQAARAFAGWQTNPLNGQFFINWSHKDFGKKEFMGQKGNFDGKDIIDIVLKDPQVSHYIVTKMWKEFISFTPEENEVARLAQIFRENNYEIEPLLFAVFTSPAFRDPKHRGVLTKSPIDLVVGTARLFDLPVKQPKQIVQFSNRLGQDLFDPPNVKGWPGGNNWINSSSLLARNQFMDRILRGMQFYISHFWVWHYTKLKNENTAADAQQFAQNGILAWIRLSPKEQVRKVQQILLPIEPVELLDEESSTDVTAAVRHFAKDLTFQLK